MEYVYSALLLHKAGKKVESLKGLNLPALDRAIAEGSR